MRMRVIGTDQKHKLHFPRKQHNYPAKVRGPTRYLPFGRIYFWRIKA